MDPVRAIKVLGSSIFHVHAKDCEILRRNVEENSLLHLLPYSQINDRPWNFRTVGYGHGEEGLQKAYELLSRIIIKDKVSAMWWKMRPEG
jgi:sugar phosphate isomerase/epimerase